MKWGLICNSKNKRSISLGIDIYNFLIDYGEIFPESSFAVVNPLPLFI